LEYLHNNKDSDVASVIRNKKVDFLKNNKKTIQRIRQQMIFEIICGKIIQKKKRKKSQNDKKNKKAKINKNVSSNTDSNVNTNTFTLSNFINLYGNNESSSIVNDNIVDLSNDNNIVDLYNDPMSVDLTTDNDNLEDLLANPDSLN
jgi:hypothetical protein